MTASAKPLVASVAGHVLLVGALIWLVGQAPPLQLPPPVPDKPVEVAFAVPQPPPPPIPDPPAIDEPPPIPEPPVVELPPPPLPEPPPVPVTQAEPPPPPPPPKPVVHRPPPRPPAERRVVTQPERPPPEPRYAPPMQTAALPPTPAPAPPPPIAAAAPTVSAGYRAELSAWLESHKQYPSTARERGEQGRVTLRFRVARNGRVLSYSVAGSSGYPDLDAAVDAMMRGATLPPFPTDMTAPEIEVSVTVRFALTR
jgi:protein TonB